MKALVSSRQRQLVLLGLAATILIIIVLLSTAGTSQKKEDYYQPLTKADLDKASMVFDLGLYIQKVYDLDLQSKTFAADGYVWIKWKKMAYAWDEQTKGAPASTLEFLNAVYRDEFKESLSPETPYTDRRGNHYQSKAFSGRFLVESLDLHKFPFETISLPIEVEADDYWITEAALQVVNRNSTGVSEKNSLNGYAYQGIDITARKHVYNTSFGLDSDALDSFGQENKAIHSNVIAKLEYNRESGSTVWRLFVPLLAVIWITILTPLIDPRNLEPKVALPASVVLSLVFLQQGYREMLPESLSYITFMDKIYGVAYVVTFIIFLEAMLSTNLVIGLHGKTLDRIARRIRQNEKRLHTWLLGTVFLLPIALWFTS